MNNSTIKKWVILLTLLLVTLLLVWQAPQVEQETQEVLDMRITSDLARSTMQAPTPSVFEDDQLKLKKRQLVTEKVNLFDSPKIKQAEIAMPRPIVKPMPVVTQVKIPFRYIGMLQEHQQTTLFLLEGNRLYLAKEGDTFNDNFQLQSIALEDKQLVWLYLPSNETLIMSIEK